MQQITVGSREYFSCKRGVTTELRVQTKYRCSRGRNDNYRRTTSHLPIRSNAKRRWNLRGIHGPVRAIYPLTLSVADDEGKGRGGGRQGGTRGTSERIGSSSAEIVRAAAAAAFAGSVRHRRRLRRRRRSGSVVTWKASPLARSLIFSPLEPARKTTE